MNSNYITMKAFLVGVVGMQQSGSTLLFNLVRFICDEMKISCHSAWLDGKFDKKKLELYKVIVVKVHDPNLWLKENADLLLLPMRDLRDASISYSARVKNTWTVEEHLKNMMTNIRFYNAWSGLPMSQTFIYEKYMEDRASWIRKLAKLLKIQRDLSDDQIKNILKKSSLLLTNPQKGTLMTRAHNTSGGQSQKYLTHFSEEDRQKILRHVKVRNFLIKHGYIHMEPVEVIEIPPPPKVHAKAARKKKRG